MKFHRTTALILGTLIFTFFVAAAAQPNPLFVTVKNPVTVSLTRDGIQIGSVTAPAGSKFEVLSQKDGKFMLKHPSGGTVEVPSGEVLGTDYRQLVGVWESDKKIWFYEFREDGSVVRACLSYPVNDPVPFAVNTEDFKATATLDKIVITLPPNWGYLELKIPFDLEKPQFVFYRANNGQYTPRPFPLTKPSPEETSAKAAAERLLEAAKAAPRRAMLKGWACWPEVGKNGEIGLGGYGIGGEVEVLGKADGMIVIRTTKSSSKVADIAVGPNALRNPIDLAKLPDVPMPKHQVEIRASSGGKILRAVESPVSIHLTNKTVELNIGSPVEISPEQTGVPEWAVKVITGEEALFVPKTSLIDGPPTVRSGQPSSNSPPKLTRKTKGQFLVFATPCHILDRGQQDIVFMPGAQILAQGAEQTGTEYGGVPGFKIENKDPGYSGFSAILPATFFVDHGAEFRSAAPPVVAALAGKGTEQDPFRIGSRKDFDAFCNDPNKWGKGVYSRLEADIDLSDTEFDDSVIAPEDPMARPEFNGFFEGNAKKILGLRITSKEGTDSGLFRVIGESGVVRNLQLISVHIQAPGLNTSAVALCGRNKGRIENSGWSGIVDGIAAALSSAGICLSNDKTGKIINCFAGGDEKSKVTGRSSGGICSLNEGLIERCGSAVEICGADSGGLVSWNRGVIRECFSGGVITDSIFVGGLCSQNSGLIENCYSLTDIYEASENASEPFVGGLVGTQRKGSTEKGGTPESVIRNCMAFGKLTSKTIAGGVVGLSQKSEKGVEGLVEGSFWNLETTGAKGSAGGTGLSTIQMKDQAIFENAGWDFKEIWLMGANGYPELRRAATADSPTKPTIK